MPTANSLNIGVQKPLQSKAKCRRTTNTLKNDKHPQYWCRKVIARQGPMPNSSKHPRNIGVEKPLQSRAICRKTANTLNIGVEKPLAAAKQGQTAEKRRTLHDRVESRCRAGSICQKTADTLNIGVEKPL
eukprot:gene7299-369_t